MLLLYCKYLKHLCNKTTFWVIIVTSIESSAFRGCSSLTAITIPEGVTSIGQSTFESCSSLTAITCHAVTPPTVESNYTFDKVDKGIPVYVPVGSVEAYKAAEHWQKLTNIIGMEAGIDTMSTANSQQPTAIYDLRGRRVEKAEKGGIYIINGRKAIVK